MKGPHDKATGGHWSPQPGGGGTGQGGAPPHGAGGHQGGQSGGVPHPHAHTQAPAGWPAQALGPTAEAQAPGFGQAPASGAPGQPFVDASGMLAAGTLLGKYQIVRALGVGGMGSVYEAVHTGIGKAVALKTMNAALASDPRSEQRFLREAAAASRLEHPHVVDVTDFGADHGIIYIVMELMRGEDLAALVQRAPAGLDGSFVADVMLPVCAGVFAAHEKGVIHRDLKPQNIFLARTALGDVVPKVLDFGISKLVGEKDQAASNLTNSGSVMGTTHYLSPEQVTGQPLDGRSDEFALGVILYECLTGRRPHEGDTIFTIMRAISEGRFIRPMQLRPDLHPALEAVVLRSMSVRPDNRYPTVHGLGRALLPFASPKGRVMWTEYFERGGPQHGGGPTSAATQAAIGLAATQWRQTQAVPGTHAGHLLPGMPMPGTGDTRSGVRPVSVMGTNELLHRRDAQARWRKLALGVLVAGGAAAAWVAYGGRHPVIEAGPRPAAEAPATSTTTPVSASAGAGTTAGGSKTPPPGSLMPASEATGVPVAPVKPTPDPLAPGAPVKPTATTQATARKPAGAPSAGAGGAAAARTPSAETGARAAAAAAAKAHPPAAVPSKPAPIAKNRRPRPRALPAEPGVAPAPRTRPRSDEIPDDDLPTRLNPGQAPILD
jgi:eukaryotic-like serine/threonine-protein kinase